MAMTQGQLNDLLQAFIGQYAGHKADYYGFEGECLSLAKRWVDAIRNGHLNGPMGAPQAAAWGSDYWTQPPQPVLDLFEHQNYDRNANYPAGSLFVNTASHHIGIMLDNRPGHTAALVFEQNADPDNSPAHSPETGRDKNRIDGILALRIAVPAPAPMFFITETYPNGRQIRLNKDTNLWGMNFDFQTMVKQPVETGHKAGEIWTVTNKVHHEDGYDYYRRDGQVDGFNVADCDDYTPPPPPAPPKPPAPPVRAEPAETYDVITKLMVFPSDIDAKSLSNYTGTDLEPGKYFVFKKSDNAYNLSTNNVQNQNKWVRITDNVVKTPEPVVPNLQVDAPATDINLPVDNAPQLPTETPQLPTINKPQYYWIRDDKLPVRLTSTNSIPVPIRDLEGKYPVQQFPAHKTEDYSMYAVVGNTEYWLPDSTRLKGWFYGVPLQFLPDEESIQPTLLDRNHNGRYDIIDLFDNGLQGFVDFGSKYLDGIKKVVTVAAPKVQQLRTPVTKTIDGFISKKRKQ